MREAYLSEMEARWEVLQYCDNHWKASKIVTSKSFYLIWYNPYHKKAIKNQNNNAHEGRPPNKKARTSSTDSEDRIGGSPEPENQAHGENEASFSHQPDLSHSLWTLDSRLMYLLISTRWRAPTI